MVSDDDKKQAQGTAAPPMQTVEFWRDKHQLTAAVFAGVSVAKDWAEGLEMAEEDFLEAVDAWLKSPVYGNK